MQNASSVALWYHPYTCVHDRFTLYGASQLYRISSNEIDPQIAMNYGPSNKLETYTLQLD